MHVQLAVLFYKPIILIIPNQLSDKSIWYFNIQRFSSLLNMPSIKTENIHELKFIPKVNKKKYNAYIKSFIKFNSSKNKFSWEIIMSNLFK